MANPKWKMSRSRTRRRRSHDALTAPNLVTCPQCKAPARPHHLCIACGTYKGRQVIALPAEEPQE